MIVRTVKNRRQRTAIPDSSPAAIEPRSGKELTGGLTTLALPIAHVFVFSIAELLIIAVACVSFLYSVLPVHFGLEKVTSAFLMAKLTAQLGAEVMAPAYNIHMNTEDATFMCLYGLTVLLHSLLTLTFLVSSSYTAFCFLGNAHYRETLQILPHEAWRRLKRIPTPRSYEKAWTTEGADEQVLLTNV